MTKIAEDIIARQERLASDRSTWEHHWQEIAERILPRQAEFTFRSRTAGEKRTEKIFDATASLALDRFASAMESMLTPRTSKWHGLRFPDDKMNENDAAKRYLESLTEKLFQMRYSAHAAFASNLHESYVSLGAFGTQVLYLEEGFDKAPILYRSLHIGECFIATNFAGMVDTVYRRFCMTPRQMIQRFGEGKVSGKVRNWAEDEKEKDREVDVIHAVYPSEKKGIHAFDSCFIEVEQRHLVHKGGYHEMPYCVSRFTTAPRETWGRGPAMTILPDIKMLNEMAKTTLRAAQKMVDPPLAVNTDGVLARPNLNPGAINPGGIDNQGREQIKALSLAQHMRPDVGEQMMERRREVVNDAFWVTLFQILVDAPTMTATEVIERSREKAQLLGPAAGRQQSELLGPLIEREMGILTRKKLLPPPPPELAGMPIEVEYTSPLARMQKAEEGVGTLRTLEVLQGLAEINPEVLDVLDDEETARGLAEINGMPLKFLRSPDEVKQIRSDRADKMEQQRQLEVAMNTAQAVGAAAPGMKAMQEAGGV